MALSHPLAAEGSRPSRATHQRFFSAQHALLVLAPPLGLNNPDDKECAGSEVKKGVGGGSCSAQSDCGPPPGPHRPLLAAADCWPPPLLAAAAAGRCRCWPDC